MYQKALTLSICKTSFGPEEKVLFLLLSPKTVRRSLENWLIISSKKNKRICDIYFYQQLKWPKSVTKFRRMNPLNLTQILHYQFFLILGICNQRLHVLGPFKICSQLLTCWLVFEQETLGDKTNNGNYNFISLLKPFCSSFFKVFLTL